MDFQQYYKKWQKQSNKYNALIVLLDSEPLFANIDTNMVSNIYKQKTIQAFDTNNKKHTIQTSKISNILFLEKDGELTKNQLK